MPSILLSDTKKSAAGRYAKSGYAFGRRAQKSIGADEQAAALKAHEEMIKNAKPKELASKDLVRKSRQYWGGFQNDMIREVFDGGFGVGIEENRDFQKTFCTYVEMFAAKCPECLPADHQNVNIIWRTNRKFDQFGNLISEENHDFTVDMDSRFVDAYKRCWTAVTSKGRRVRRPRRCSTGRRRAAYPP